MNEREIFLTMASTARISVPIVGNVTLILENKLEPRKKLISISSLNKSYYSVCSNKNVFIRKNGSFIFLGILVDNLICITPISLLYIVENNRLT